MANYLLFQKIIAVRLKKVYGLLINIFFILKFFYYYHCVKVTIQMGYHFIIIFIGFEMKAEFFHINKY